MPLIKVRLDDYDYNEETLQELLFNYPELLPLDELEAGVESLVAVAREVESGAGPIDLLCFDTSGNIVIVETKLWRNPEARRKVVAQIIDYASHLSLLSYENLIERIRAVRDDLPEDKNRDPLAALVEAESGEPVDEARFVDRVTSNLSKGRMLLVIVGDGIRSGLETMSGFLQRHPQLGFTLGLVELNLYRPDKETFTNDDVLVVPRLIGRTREVVRSVVEVRTISGAAQPEINVSIPEKHNGSRGRTTGRPTSIS
ncbi:MAG: endonuclease NucS, partial [Planctomycetota bacterium]|nr:endonuclease NucS [Planctomycetota bacterium]